MPNDLRIGNPLTTEDIHERIRQLRALYRTGTITTMGLTVHLYGLYVEAVQEIAEGEVDDPQQFCAALIRAVAGEFPDRPWADASSPSSTAPQSDPVASPSPPAS